MGRTYRGPYARPANTTVPYATAAVWGTGINPIHAYYGEGPPLRVDGRSGSIGGSPVAGPAITDKQSPADSSGIDPPEYLTWGYPLAYGPDSFGSGANSSPSDTAPATSEYMGSRPAWGDAPQIEIVRRRSRMPSVGRSGENFRRSREGAHRYRENPHGPIVAEPTNAIPNETVSEGWENKVTSFVANADTSDPAQYEVQTSMRQRYLSRDNERAVARGTDASRTAVASRVAGMVLKVYSTGERTYDMQPYEINQIDRPFRYRTAGTGPREWMRSNEAYSVTPVERTPPPEPAFTGNTPPAMNYGYTPEDGMYFG